MPDKGGDELGPARHLGGCYDTRTPISIMAVVELLAEAMLGGTIDCHSGVSRYLGFCLKGHGYSMFILDFQRRPPIFDSEPQ